MLYSTSAFIRRCVAVEDSRGLWEEVCRFFRSRGVERLMYHDDTPGADWRRGNGVSQFGVEPEVVRLCEDLLARHPDLLHMAATQSGGPFFIDDIGLYTKLDPAEEAALSRLLMAGMTNTLVMQVFGPNLIVSVVCMGFPEVGVRPNRVRVFDLQCAAQAAHLKAISLRAPVLSQLSALSPREIEVLRWCARGKSTPVIAEILGISRHTVDTLLRRVFEKLNVHDRTGAAIEGLRTGVLRLRGAEIV